MSFKPTVGAAGITHLSQVEAKLSFPLFELGIVSDESFYPEPFIDRDGESFRAKKDFHDTYVPEISYEIKSGKLNGLRSCATAATARARFEQAYAAGYIEEKHKDYKKLESSWSASVQKFKLVQNQTAEAGNIVVMVFPAKPPVETLKRLNSAKVLWFVYGDSDWRWFMSFRTCAKLGLRSEFTIKGHALTSHSGVLLH